MKKTALVLGGFTAIAFGLAACSKPAAAPSAPAAESTPADSAGSGMATMTPDPAAVTGPVQGVGTVTAIDAAAGTVMLDHEAINAIMWPAMSMQFKVEDPSILKGIAKGDHVSFELKSATETGLITKIEKQ